MATYGSNSAVFYVFISFRPKGQNSTSFPAVSLGQSPILKPWRQSKARFKNQAVSTEQCPSLTRVVRAEPDSKTKKHDQLRVFLRASMGRRGSARVQAVVSRVSPIQRLSLMATSECSFEPIWLHMVVIVLCFTISYNVLHKVKIQQKNWWCQARKLEFFQFPVGGNVFKFRTFLRQHS